MTVDAQVVLDRLADTFLEEDEKAGGFSWEEHFYFLERIRVVNRADKELMEEFREHLEYYETDFHAGVSGSCSL